jgi:rubredoxin
VHSANTSSQTTPERSSTTCPVCGDAREPSLWKKRNLDRRLTPEDLLITDSRYGVTLELWKCAGCGFIFAKGAEIDELESLYARLDDPEYDA